MTSQDYMWKFPWSNFLHTMTTSNYQSLCTYCTSRLPCAIFITFVNFLVLRCWTVGTWNIIGTLNRVGWLMSTSSTPSTSYSSSSEDSSCSGSSSVPPFDKKSKEDGGHTQILHSKSIGRFQIQWFHIEMPMGVLRDFKVTSAKGRTTITFQDHMWKQWLLTVSVPLGFPDFVGLQGLTHLTFGTVPLT